MLVFESEAICFSVSPASYTDVHYSKAEKERLTELFRLEKWLFRRIPFSMETRTSSMNVAADAAFRFHATKLISSLQATT